MRVGKGAPAGTWRRRRRRRHHPTSTPPTSMPTHTPLMLISPRASGIFPTNTIPKRDCWRVGGSTPFSLPHLRPSPVHPPPPHPKCHLHFCPLEPPSSISINKYRTANAQGSHGPQQQVNGCHTSTLAPPSLPPGHASAATRHPPAHPHPAKLSSSPPSPSLLGLTLLHVAPPWVYHRQQDAMATPAGTTPHAPPTPPPSPPTSLPPSTTTTYTAPSRLVLLHALYKARLCCQVSTAGGVAATSAQPGTTRSPEPINTRITHSHHPPTLTFLHALPSLCLALMQPGHTLHTGPPGIHWHRRRGHLAHMPPLRPPPPGRRYLAQASPT